jgi:hypothetical protein
VAHMLLKSRLGSISRLLPAMVVFILLCAPVRAQQPSEHEVKAAYLYNFANFVEWPSEPPPNTSTTLNIGILGRDPLGVAFETIEGKKVRGQPVRVYRSHRLADLRDCQILFIGNSERTFVPQILADLAGRSVLTVGESDGFAEQGVIIDFYMVDNKVRFKINVEAGTRAGLKLSSKLLKLAQIVRTREEQ